MELVEFHCKDCGGNLKFENGGYQCQTHPDHFFVERDILEQREKLRSILGEAFTEELLKAKEEKIANLRSNLWEAVHAEFISVTDIKNRCEELKKEDSGDVQAKFYSDIISGIPAKINSCLKNTDVKSNSITTFIEFAIRKLHNSQSTQALSEIIERYGKEGGSRYAELQKEYLKKSEEVHKKIRNVDIAYDCFVSYDNREKTEVDKLVGELETGKNKLKCFVAYRNLPDDYDNFWTNIHKAMKNCKMFLLVSSDKSRNNDNVLNELSYWMHYIKEDFRPFRAEYLLEEYCADVSEGDRTVNENFTDFGLTWFKQGKEKDLIHKLCTFRRQAKLSKSTELVATEQQNVPLNRNMKYCLSCGTGNVQWAEVCSKKGCGGEQFVDSYEKYLDFKNEKEYNEKLQRLNEDTARRQQEAEKALEEERKRLHLEQEQFRIAQEKELARIRLEYEEKLRKEIEEQKKLYLNGKQSDTVDSNYPTLENYDKNEFEIEDTVLIDYKLTDKKGKVKIPYGVTAIGEDAFYECEELTGIEIPNSVTEIGDGAFSYCSGLNCVEIPNGITTIGEGTFYDCCELAGIIIPDSVTEIGESAFCHCSGLTSIEIPNSVTTIGKQAFYGCSGMTHIEIPNSVTEIGEMAFFGCEHLTSITIPNKVTTIKKMAFSSCSGLTHIVIPNSVTIIGEGAFSFCSELASIKISDSITSIGEGAFCYCSELSDIEIPGSVTSIGARAFGDCSGLTSITVGKGNKKYYSKDNCLIEKDTNKLILGCKNSVMPQNITTIGEWAFDSCSGLMGIEIPYSVTLIEAAAFSGCRSLTNIKIPDSVTSIGIYAFDGCTSLQKVTMPKNLEQYVDSAFGTEKAHIKFEFTDNDEVYPTLDNYSNDEFEIEGTVLIDYKLKDEEGEVRVPEGITEIDEWAFHSCKSLTNIILPDSLKIIGDAAFNNCQSLTNIFIPQGVVKIGRVPFADCSVLSNITIDSKNNAYHIAGNCLIETVSKTLIEGFANSFIPTDGSVEIIGEHAFDLCENLNSIILPDCINTISEYAFNCCSGLKSIKLPKELKNIGEWAFYGCENLENIIISENIKQIGQFAFIGCENLKSLYYFGTLKSFNKFMKEVNIEDNNDDLEDAIIYYYSENQPKQSQLKKHKYWHYVDGEPVKW